jgi:lysophospholipase L1-like esterase
MTDTTVHDGSYSRNKLRICCFGDSLTWGFVSRGAQHSYSKKLLQLISSDFPNIAVELSQHGKKGETTGSMVSRLTKLLKKDSKYDVVIILGGTNDIFLTEATTQNLEQMYKVCRSYNALVIMASLPPAEYDKRPNSTWILESKKKINDFIRQLIPNKHFIDLSNELPLHSLSESDKDALWSDHMHPSAAGYDMMADIIYDKLKAVIRDEIIKE